MKAYISTFLITLGTLVAPLYSLELGFEDKLNIQLQEPHFKNGVLSTDKGGVISGKDFSVQARSIKYIRTITDNEPEQLIEASGDLFFMYKSRPYAGDKAIFDLRTGTLTVYNGCTAISTWFVGGKKIVFQSDGNGYAEDAFSTTSENQQDEWAVKSSSLTMQNKEQITANQNIFYFSGIPFFWVPTYTRDLQNNSKGPFHLRVRYKSGMVQVGMSYDFIKTRTTKTQLLFDVGLKKGLGGGFVGSFKSSERPESFYTFNYVAHDIPSSDNRYLRYRFQGKYLNNFFDDKVNFRLTYDKLSDSKIRTDYPNKTLDSSHIVPTQALFTRRTENWIASLNTRFRVNNFQTIKEELPLFTFNNRPIQLGDSGAVLNNRFSAGYLNYKYSRHSPHVRDFHSTRAELSQDVYRPFHTGIITTTPYAGYTVISYNRSPQDKAQLQALAKAGFESHMRFVRPTDHGSQAVEPYVQYDYLTTPSVRPHNHYVFDLEDGFYRLNIMRIGFRNSFLSKDVESGFLRRYFFDLYTRAFINTRTQPTTFPKLYLDGKIKPTSSTAYFLQFAYDDRHSCVDHFNIKGDFTVNQDLAFALEYRHRSAYAWRKVDPDNFILDSFRNTKALKKSILSDRRDTFLAHLYYALSSTLSADLYTRYGWHRKKQPSYLEYGLDIATLIHGAMSLTFTYSHKPKNNTYTISFSFGGNGPAKDTGFSSLGRGNYDN